MDRNFFESNKLVYIPAILPSMDLVNTKDNILFYNKNDVFTYNNILVSAYHSLYPKEIKLSNNLKLDGNQFILGDSGGFQAVTLGNTLNPKDVIKWQMNNCNAGLILDVPPYKFGGSAQFSGTPSKEFFQECLDKTYENAKTALQENKGENKIRLYGVIQGETFEQMNQWFNRIHSLENDKQYFDAWALSPKPSTDPIKIAMLGIIILENKVNKPLHILQISGKNGMIISAFLRHLLQNTITIDSSSTGISTRYGLIYDPINTPSTLAIGTKNTYFGDKWLCDCPICKRYNISAKNINNNLEEANLHNLYQIVKYVKYVDFIVDYDEKEIFSEAKRTSDNCVLALNILKDYKENGLNYIKKKYNEIFNPKEITEQKTIFEAL